MQKSSLRPELDVGWKDTGGLALTLALENASILHTDEGSDVILDTRPSAKPSPSSNEYVWLGVTPSISASWKTRAVSLLNFARLSPDRESGPGSPGAALNHLCLHPGKLCVRETPAVLWGSAAGNTAAALAGVAITIRGALLRVARLVLGSLTQAVSPSVLRLGVLALAV